MSDCTATASPCVHCKSAWSEYKGRVSLVFQCSFDLFAQSGTQGYAHRSLFNLAEGPFILAAIEAARDILRIATRKLHTSNLLAQCPLRIFHRILYAVTFLLKVVAIGVVEGGGSDTIHPLLDDSARAMKECAAMGRNHVAKGMALLLSHMLRVHRTISGEDTSNGATVVTGSAFMETTTVDASVNARPTTLEPPNLFLPTVEGLELHRQQDQAFRELFGDEIMGDSQLSALFASCLDDDYGNS